MPSICIPGLTEWMNIDTPFDEDGNDIETIDQLRYHHMFCQSPVDIECREIGTDVDPVQNIICNLTMGLICLRTDQDNDGCKDYAVRFDCGNCGVTTILPEVTTAEVTTAEVTTAEVTTAEVTPTPACPPGHVYKADAFPCDDLCESSQSRATECPIPGCVPIGEEKFCDKPGHLIMIVDGVVSCIKESHCMCWREDTQTYMPPASTWRTGPCEDCICANNSIMCVTRTTGECRVGPTTAAATTAVPTTEVIPKTARKTTELPIATTEFRPTTGKATTRAPVVTTKFRPTTAAPTTEVIPKTARKTTEFPIGTTAFRPTTGKATTRAPVVTTEFRPTTGVITTVTLPPLEVCPDIVNTSLCPAYCPPGEACDGGVCVDKATCPCVYNGKIIKHRGFVRNDKCEHCMCFNTKVIGCHTYCEIESCPVGSGLVHPDDDCCYCEPCECDATEYQCRSSTSTASCEEQCISNSLICDGKADCDGGEDEEDCPTTAAPTTLAPTTLAPTTTVKVTTGTPPPGCYSPSGEYIPVGGSFIQGCQKCKCFDGSFGTYLGCEPHGCLCQVYGDDVKTFDNTEFKYPVCDHVLARNSTSSPARFEVRLISVCQSDADSYAGEEYTCTKHLVVGIDNFNIMIDNDGVSVNGQSINIAQISMVQKQVKPGVIVRIQRTGEKTFVRTSLGLSASWSQFTGGQVKIEESLLGRVSGLCGLANNDPADDFTKPDGVIVEDNMEFGDSWGSRDVCPVPVEDCATRNPDLASEARSACEILRSDRFQPCHQHVDVAEYIELCESQVCECLVNSSATADECVCDILTKYSTDCANSEGHVILDWRSPNVCPAPECTTPTMWQDCLSACEWTCTEEGLPYQTCPDGCNPGCGCMPGQVKKGDTCVKPDDCKDCNCDGYGGIHFYSFDGKSTAFDGNCSYVLARSTAPSPEFEIFFENFKCDFAWDPSCVSTTSITVVYRGNEVVLTKGPKVILNGEEVSFPPDINIDGIHVMRPCYSWVLHLTIPEIKLEVAYYDRFDGFSVTVPESKYKDNTEGLCGVCNHDPSDDRKKPNGEVVEDSVEFAESWQRTDNGTCLITSVPSRHDMTPSPTDEEECHKAIFEGVFEECNILVDPNKYYRACLLDKTCKNDHCDVLAAYANECSKVDMCLDWREEHDCPVECPEGKQYEACHRPCRLTCVNMNKPEDQRCSGPDLEGCFCPDGTFEDELGNCVESCERCIEADGMVRQVNETWTKDSCMTCECIAGGQIQCTKISCPVEPVCPSYKRLSSTIGEGDCCVTHECVCDIDLCPEESRQPSPQCNADQQVVSKTINECCDRQECECLPCSQPMVPTCAPYETIESYKENPEDCCDSFRCVCNKANCPMVTLTCPDFKEIAETPESVDSCCPDHECVCSCPDEQSIVCNVGYTAQSVLTHQECDCYGYQCVPKEVCLWDSGDGEMEEVQPGTTDLVGKDACRKCDCTETREGEFYTLDCKVTECEVTSQADCGLDSEFVPAEEGVCCGTCQARWCIDGGERHEIGDRWTPDDAKTTCDYYECREDQNGEPQLYPYYTLCPPVSPSVEECVGPFYNLTTDGCCPVCVLAKTACKQYTEEMEVELDGCKSKGTIEIASCEGRCYSLTSFNWLLGRVKNDCTCCQVKSSSKRNVDLFCEDGSVRSQEYTYIEECDCLPCVPDPDR